MKSITQARRWFVTRPRNSPAALRLFCFPYAGGNTPIFRNWQQFLPADIEVCAVQLPGRGTRLKEPPFYNMEPLVEVIAEALSPYFDLPFTFFGHSMGAIISFELTRLLRERRGDTVAHLFVSGRPAPQLPSKQKITYNLPEASFCEELGRLNGTPAEVLENPQLMELMLPLLRADFSMVETYAYQPGPPLDCPITAFGGEHDEQVSTAEIEAWREQTLNDFGAHIMTGDHFFINNPQTQMLMLRTIATKVRHLLQPPAGEERARLFRWY